MKIKGLAEFHARLRAIADVGRPIGRKWSDTTADEARRTAPRRTGRLRRSIRPGPPTAGRATVSAIWYGRLVNSGTGPHVITPRRRPALVFEGSSGRTIFAKKVRHRGTRPTRFADKAARLAMRRNPMSDTLINVWNRAA